MTALLTWLGGLSGRTWLLVLLIAAAALGVEELRLAWLRTDLAAAEADLAACRSELERARQAETLLRDDQVQAGRALDGAREQLRAERLARARAQARAEERDRILAGARTIPAEQIKGGVVDDQTSAGAVAHLNGLLR